MKLVDRLRWLWKKSREEVLVISFTMLLMITISFLMNMAFGWLGIINSLPGVRGTPEANTWLLTAPDSDNDQLPDLMEETPKGEPVLVNGREVAKGTGTDPFDPDTDNDLFPDNAELKIGSNPYNWFDPGWVWIMWALFIGGAVYKLYIHKPDRLKEYKINEELISKGVSGKGGKFAYGGSSIFGKPVDELTEEEKKEILASDARIAELTGLPEDQEEFIQQRKKRRLRDRLIMFSLIAFFVYLSYVLTVLI